MQSLFSPIFHMFLNFIESRYVQIVLVQQNNRTVFSPKGFSFFVTLRDFYTMVVRPRLYLLDHIRSFYAFKVLISAQPIIVSRSTCCAQGLERILSKYVQFAIFGQTVGVRSSHIISLLEW